MKVASISEEISCFLQADAIISLSVDHCVAVQHRYIWGIYGSESRQHTEDALKDGE